MKKIFTLLNSFKALGLMLVLLPNLVSGQTNPSPHNLATSDYSQNFGTTTFTTVPANMAAWNGVSGAAVTTQALSEASAPAGNATIAAVTTATTTGGTYGLASSSNGRFYVQTSSNTTNGANQLALALNTTDRGTVILTYDVEIISAQPKTVGVVCQYRNGTSGTWTTLTATTGNNPYSQAAGTTGLKTTVSATLPATANNQSVVQIRWATWRGTESGNSSGIAIDNVTVSSSACTYTASASDNWTTAANWGVCGVPTSTTDVVIPTGVTITLDANATINNLTFTGGGKLTLGANTLTVNGTATGSATAGWVVTDGSGLLSQSVTSAGKLFPIGASASSYDKVTITNTTGTNNFSASVKTGFTNGPTDATKVFNREWNVTSTSAGATLAFTPDVASTPAPAPTTVTLGHYTGGAWVEKIATVNSGTYSATFTSFSPFGVGQNGAFSGIALSVELVSFTVKAINNKNTVSWSTASEKNNAQFNIERSTNGETFTSVGSVKGNGTTNAENNYTFEDATPALGMNYYRLRQVDFDGTETLSKVVSVIATGKNGALKVYPTLASDKLNVSLDSKETVDFNIYNLVGQSVQSGQLTGQKELIISHLPNGAYFLKVGNTTVKFSKN